MARYKNVVTTEFINQFKTIGRKAAEKEITSMERQQRQLNETQKKSNKSTKESGKEATTAREKWARFLGIGLSAMFISQGLASAFSGMMRPILEITGVFDVWRATLISVLGPVLIPFSLFLIKIMTSMMDLPKPVKIIIGVFVGLAAIVFTLISWLAQLFLLFISLAGKGATVGSFFTLVGTVLGWVASIVLILYGAISVVTGFLKSNFWPVLKGILLILAGVLGIIALVVGGWIPALIAGVITLIVFLAEKFQWMRSLLMTLALPLKTIFELIMAIVEGFKTGDWGKAFKELPGKIIKGTLIGDAAGAMGANIPGLAEGGIVTKPTLAMVGEAGPEAVVPLGAGNTGGGVNIQINLSNAQFKNNGQMNNLIQMIKSALREELRRLGLA